MEKKKLFLIILGIFILSVLLRLFNIDKQEGMWNDEYLTWEIAKAPLWAEFLRAIAKNCHAPLHYLYLKMWMAAFGDSDVSLRFSSFVPGVLSVITMFFAGRLAAKKTSDTSGIAAASICAISSFLIYFSQEVRIYSLLFLLTSLNVICALICLENPSKKNCTFFVLTSFLIMLEHTIGFVFVFFSVVSLILFSNNKTKFKKYLLSALVAALLIFIPVAFLLYNIMFKGQYFSQWWAPFSYAKLAFFFSDLFSPYLINITNAPPSFTGMIYDGNTLNIGFLLFVGIPLSLCLICAIKAVCNFDKNVKYILLTAFGMYLTVFAASLFDKIVFLTKYMTEIYPLLILLVAIGFASFKNRGFKISIATIYCVITMFFFFASDYSPVKLIREEGQNIPVAMLNNLQYKETDKVLFLYYPKTRFLKYSPVIAQNPNSSDISKYEFNILDKMWRDSVYIQKNGKDFYRDILISPKSTQLDYYLNKDVYSSIKTGDRFFLVDFAPVSIFTPQNIIQIATNPQRFDKTPLLFMIFSYVRNYIVYSANSLLSYEGVVEKQAWRIYVFKKT